MKKEDNILLNTRRFLICLLILDVFALVSTFFINDFLPKPITSLNEWRLILGGLILLMSLIILVTIYIEHTEE